MGISKVFTLQKGVSALRGSNSRNPTIPSLWDGIHDLQRIIIASQADQETHKDTNNTPKTPTTIDQEYISVRLHFTRACDLLHREY